jgi:hypothetical protein
MLVTVELSTRVRYRTPNGSSECATLGVCNVCPYIWGLVCLKLKEKRLAVKEDLTSAAAVICSQRA